MVNEKMKDERKLIEVAHVSKRGSSLRISIPRKVAESIGILEGEIVGFYTDGKKIFLEKVD